MNVNYIELEDDDVVIVSHNVGNIPNNDIDEYCKPIVNALVKVFGKDKVVLLPIKDGATWEFTVVRKC